MVGVVRTVTIASTTLAATLIAGTLVAVQGHNFRDTAVGDGSSHHVHEMADGQDTDGSVLADGAATKTRISMMSASTLPRLRGYVGGDGSITISKHRVPRGRYRIVVLDDTNHHNWHISGNYIDKETTVRGSGRWVWRVRLRKGTYSIVCDPHRSWMNTYVKVTAG